MISGDCTSIELSGLSQAVGMLTLPTSVRTRSLTSVIGSAKEGGGGTGPQNLCLCETFAPIVAATTNNHLVRHAEWANWKRYLCSSLARLPFRPKSMCWHRDI